MFTNENFLLFTYLNLHNAVLSLLEDKLTYCFNFIENSTKF